MSPVLNVYLNCFRTKHIIKIKIFLENQQPSNTIIIQQSTDWYKRFRRRIKTNVN